MPLKFGWHQRNYIVNHAYLILCVNKLLIGLRIFKLLEESTVILKDYGKCHILVSNDCWDLIFGFKSQLSLLGSQTVTCVHVIPSLSNKGGINHL